MRNVEVIVGILCASKWYWLCKVACKIELILCQVVAGMGVFPFGTFIRCLVAFCWKQCSRPILGLHCVQICSQAIASQWQYLKLAQMSMECCISFDLGVAPAGCFLYICLGGWVLYCPCLLSCMQKELDNFSACRIVENVPPCLNKQVECACYNYELLLLFFVATFCLLVSYYLKISCVEDEALS